MKVDPHVIHQAFNEISDPTDPTAILTFVTAYFESEGCDLDVWIPTDFNENPPFLQKIDSTQYKEWASDLNQLWVQLGRQVKGVFIVSAY